MRDFLVFVIFVIVAAVGPFLLVRWLSPDSSPLDDPAPARADAAVAYCKAHPAECPAAYERWLPALLPALADGGDVEHRRACRQARWFLNYSDPARSAAWEERVTRLCRDDG